MNANEIANVILDIIDREKRYVATDYLVSEGLCHEDEIGSTEELRMQLREIAFALIQGKKVSPDMLS